MFAAWATLANALKSGTLYLGLPIVSTSARQYVMTSQAHTNPSGTLVNRLGKVFRIVSLDEPKLDSEPLEKHFELVVRPAIQVGSRQNVVAGFGNGRNRQKLGRLATARGYSSNASFQRGETFLKDVDGGVVDARVDNNWSASQLIRGQSSTYSPLLSDQRGPPRAASLERHRTRSGRLARREI